MQYPSNGSDTFPLPVRTHGKPLVEGGDAPHGYHPPDSNRSYLESPTGLESAIATALHTRDFRMLLGSRGVGVRGEGRRRWGGDAITESRKRTETSGAVTDVWLEYLGVLSAHLISHHMPRGFRHDTVHLIKYHIIQEVSIGIQSWSGTLINRS